MKKLIVILTALFLIPLQVNALENGDVLNLHTGNSYILPVGERAVNLQNSNPGIVTAEADTFIDAKDSSVLLTTLEEGIAYISFKQKEKTVTLKILIDNRSDEDTNLLKLDKPDETGIKNK